MKKQQSLSALEKLEKTREEHKVNFHLTPDGKNMLAPLINLNNSWPAAYKGPCSRDTFADNSTLRSPAAKEEYH